MYTHKLTTETQIVMSIIRVEMEYSVDDCKDCIEVPYTEGRKKRQTCRIQNMNGLILISSQTQP